jgi:hypothetical protein
MLPLSFGLDDEDVDEIEEVNTSLGGFTMSHPEQQEHARKHMAHPNLFDRGGFMDDIRGCALAQGMQVVSIGGSSDPLQGTLRVTAIGGGRSSGDAANRDGCRDRVRREVSVRLTLHNATNTTLEGFAVQLTGVEALHLVAPHPHASAYPWSLGVTSSRGGGRVVDDPSLPGAMDPVGVLSSRYRDGNRERVGSVWPGGGFSGVPDLHGSGSIGAALALGLAAAAAPVLKEPLPTSPDEPSRRHAPKEGLPSGASITYHWTIALPNGVTKTARAVPDHTPATMSVGNSSPHEVLSDVYHATIASGVEMAHVDLDLSPAISGSSNVASFYYHAHGASALCGLKVGVQLLFPSMEMEADEDSDTDDDGDASVQNANEVEGGDGSFDDGGFGGRSGAEGVPERVFASLPPVMLTLPPTAFLECADVAFRTADAFQSLWESLPFSRFTQASAVAQFSVAGAAGGDRDDACEATGLIFAPSSPRCATIDVFSGASAPKEQSRRFLLGNVHTDARVLLGGDGNFPSPAAKDFGSQIIGQGSATAAFLWRSAAADSWVAVVVTAIRTVSIATAEEQSLAVLNSTFTARAAKFDGRRRQKNKERRVAQRIQRREQHLREQAVATVTANIPAPTAEATVLLNNVAVNDAFPSVNGGGDGEDSGFNAASIVESNKQRPMVDIVEDIKFNLGISDDDPRTGKRRNMADLVEEAMRQLGLSNAGSNAVTSMIDRVRLVADRIGVSVTITLNNESSAMFSNNDAPSVARTFDSDATSFGDSASTVAGDHVAFDKAGTSQQPAKAANVKQTARSRPTEAAASTSDSAEREQHAPPLLSRWVFEIETRCADTALLAALHDRYSSTQSGHGRREKHGTVVPLDDYDGAGGVVPDGGFDGDLLPPGGLWVDFLGDGLLALDDRLVRNRAMASGATAMPRRALSLAGRAALSTAAAVAIAKKKRDGSHLREASPDGIYETKVATPVGDVNEPPAKAAVIGTRSVLTSWRQLQEQRRRRLGRRFL